MLVVAQHHYIALQRGVGVLDAAGSLPDCF